MTLYASNAQIKAALGITDTDRDTLISMAGSAASELIDLHTGRTFGTTGTVVRYFAPADNWLLPVDDLAGTAITVETSTSANGTYDVTFTPSDYQLEPLNARLNGVPWPYTALRAVGDHYWPTASGEATVRVTGVYGWPAIPSVVVQAAVLQGARLYMRYQSPLGVAGGNEFGAMRVTRSLDPDVAVMLADFRDGNKVAGGIA